MKTKTIKINKDTKTLVKLSGVHYIDVPIYNCGIEIIFKDSTKKLEAMWGNTTEYGGQTRDYLKNDSRILVSFPSDKPNMGTVTHELCHATQMILKWVKHDYYESSADEPFAYLLGFLVREYLKIKK